MQRTQYKSMMVEKILDELNALHTPATKWEVDTGTDATGDDAIWVWAIVDDAKISHLSQESRARLRDKVREAVSRVSESPESSVYVRFRATSEV